MYSISAATCCMKRGTAETPWEIADARISKRPVESDSRLKGGLETTWNPRLLT